MTPFTLRRQGALAWSGEHEWRKGQSYIRGLTGLSARPEGAGTVLRGVAYGQEPYQVRATLEGGEVVSARCSCPVGGGGRCKHVAALLARAVENSAAFAPLQELSEVLGGLDIPELHGLIARMLDRAPELEALVYASSARSAPAGSARQQIEAAFDAIRRSYNPEWDHEGEGPDTEAIDLVLEGADALLENLEALDSAWAGQVLDTYLAVLEGVEENSDDFEWGLDDLQEHAQEAVQDLLSSGKLDEDARAEALEAVRGEVASGRGNLEGEAFSDFVAALREGERAELLELLRDLMRGARYDFEREQYAGVLYRLTAGQLTDEGAETLLRAQGDLGALLTFLLERGRAQDARRAVREAGWRARFPELEPVFAAHDQLPLLEALAGEGREQGQTRRWLFERYVATGRKPEAHALAREAVRQSPSQDWLISLKDVSPDWEGERAEITSRLWRQREQTETLMALLLREGLAEEALRLAGERETVPAHQLLTLAGQLGPPRAVPLIVRGAQLQIDRRSRGGYHEAAQILARLPALIGREETGAQVRAVIERQPRLPALRDELRQAGLL